VIVDAHTHAWARWPYPPAEPGDGAPAERGRYQDLIGELDAAGVNAAVLVSANLDGPAGDGPVGAGSDGDGDNNDYGAAAVAACPGRLFQFADVDSRWSPAYHRAGSAARLADVVSRLAPAGVSHYLGPENDGWLRSAEGRGFLAAADRRATPVSLAAPPAWFADVCVAAASVPATPVLLNHLALVMLDAGGRAAALDLIRRGAGQPNLVVKVSGYYYGADGPDEYPFAGRLELVRAFYETWGPARMAWASDYPACTPHISYRQSLAVIREQAGFIDPADLPLILGGTMTAILNRTWQPVG
jgi:L-fuconolactonase